MPSRINENLLLFDIVTGGGDALVGNAVTEFEAELNQAGVKHVYTEMSVPRSPFGKCSFTSCANCPRVRLIVYGQTQPYPFVAAQLIKRGRYIVIGLWGQFSVVASPGISPISRYENTDY